MAMRQHSVAGLRGSDAFLGDDLRQVALRFNDRVQAAQHGLDHLVFVFSPALPVAERLAFEQLAYTATGEFPGLCQVLPEVQRQLSTNSVIRIP